MKKLDEIKEQQLIARRFNGDEIFQVTLAEWKFVKDGSMPSRLVVNLDCYAEKLSPELAEISNVCNWELVFSKPEMQGADLVQGFTASIPESYDEDEQDYITNFCFTEHIGTNNNKVEILEVNGDRLLLYIYGEVEDLEYYKEKPDTELHVKAWFSVRL